MTYEYIQSEPELWTVGYYDPNGKWMPESDHDRPKEAAARVAYLNGSTTPAEVLDELLGVSLEELAKHSNDPKFLAKIVGLAFNKGIQVGQRQAHEGINGSIKRRA